MPEMKEKERWQRVDNKKVLLGIFGIIETTYNNDFFLAIEITDKVQYTITDQILKIFDQYQNCRNKGWTIKKCSMKVEKKCTKN